MTDQETTERVRELTNFLNFGMRSGYVDPKPILHEIARLLNLPAGTVK